MTMEQRLLPVWPVANAAVPVAIMTVLHQRSPFVHGNYPTCPFHAATGLWCPGCGSVRALALMSHGRIADAASYNVLAVAWVTFSIALLGWWVWRTWRRRSPMIVLLGQRVGPVLVSLATVFTVARNLPWQPLMRLAP